MFERNTRIIKFDYVITNRPVPSNGKTRAEVKVISDLKIKEVAIDYQAKEVKVILANAPVAGNVFLIIELECATCLTGPRTTEIRPLIVFCKLLFFDGEKWIEKKAFCEKISEISVLQEYPSFLELPR